MYQGLIHLHNLLRWIILILLVWNIVRHFAAGKNPFNGTDKKLSLFLLISAHSTLLLGLYQWFTGALGFQMIKTVGMGVAMKDPAMRFWAVEHITGMVIAIILITIANGIAKKDIPVGSKHTKIAVMLLIALGLMLAVIPWPFREAIARPWFPGM